MQIWDLFKIQRKQIIKEKVSFDRQQKEEKKRDHSS